MSQLNLVEVIDNCFFGPLSLTSVKTAFGERLQRWNRLTKLYQLVNNIDYLALNWPADRFASAEIPVAVYGVTGTCAGIDIPCMHGFLETKLHFRDYAILCQLVTFPIETIALRSQVVTRLMQQFRNDCRDMEVEFIVIPRAKKTTSSTNVGGKYNLMHVDLPSTWEIHWGDLCENLSVEFPYMSFETPFTSSFIHVRSPEQLPLVRNWVHYCLLPTRHSRKGRIDFCRMHHYSLWRTINARNQKTPLLPHEVDILINWQKKSIVHNALVIDAVTECPASVFGKPLVQIADHIHRLQIVAYRHLQRVPPHLLRAEITDWFDAVKEDIEYKEEEDLAGPGLTTQQDYDRVRRERRAALLEEETPVEIPEQKEPKPWRRPRRNKKQPPRDVTRYDTLRPITEPVATVLSEKESKVQAILARHREQDTFEDLVRSAQQQRVRELVPSSKKKTRQTKKKSKKKSSQTKKKTPSQAQKEPSTDEYEQDIDIMSNTPHSVLNEESDTETGDESEPEINVMT